MGTIIVSILLVIWICLVLRTIYKNKKKGIGVCGHNCNTCGTNNLCHADLYKMYRKEMRKEGHAQPGGRKTVK